MISNRTYAERLRDEMYTAFNKGDMTLWLDTKCEENNRNITVRLNLDDGWTDIYEMTVSNNPLVTLRIRSTDVILETNTPKADSVSRISVAPRGSDMLYEIETWFENREEDYKRRTGLS